jgi:nucleotidyltransferase/DNA polymerase involved in DNA repair
MVVCDGSGLLLFFIVHFGFLWQRSRCHAAVQVLRTYDPAFEAMSLDEAYLDVTSFFGSSSRTAPQVTHLSIANEIRERVFQATGLTCSAGAAANKLIAKICRSRPLQRQ